MNNSIIGRGGGGRGGGREGWITCFGANKDLKCRALLYHKKFSNRYYVAY